MSVHFTQSCPTCGRRIRVRASLMGMSVACQHCNATFKADGDDHPFDSFSSLKTGNTDRSIAEPMEHVDPLMARVEKALKMASDQSTIV